MNVLPKSDVELMEFVASHLPVWSADPAGVGLSGSLLAELSALQDTALASRRAADAARQAALAATLEAHNDADRLRANAATLVRAIKAFAQQQSTPNDVYVAAQIPAPKQPGPTAAPPTATNLEMQLVPGGAIRVNWQAVGGSPSTGCVFKVLRSTASVPGGSGGGRSGAFATVGVGTSLRGGKYTFVDDTLPVGTPSARYVVVGMHGNVEGDMSDAITVQFGAGANVAAGAVKLAA